MKTTLKYALGAVLTVALVAPALAQDNFPDVPENHWAFEALAKMKKEGLLVGYPDGLYRGGRPASRYELAVAVHATYERLKGLIDALDAKIGGNTGPGGGDVTKEQFQALKDQVEALQGAMNNMKAWGDDIANLKKMSATFEKELASLGVDVEAMKKDLADLNSRVGVLEKHKPAVDIHGDVNLFVAAGMSQSHRPGVTVDGRPTGVVDGFYGNNGTVSGLTEDLSVFHEGALRISGTNETGPMWHATLAVGNLIGATGFAGAPFAGAYPGQAGTASGSPILEGPTDIYFQDFVVAWNDSLMKQGFSASLGRQGYKISPYILMRPDNTPYFSNERWDNGEWTMDGGMFGFNFGAAKFSTFVGRQGNRLTTNGVELQAMSAGRIGVPYTVGGARPVGLAAGAINVDQTAGATLNVPLGDKGGLDLAYLWLEDNTRNGGGAYPNRSEVFGGEANFKVGPIALTGGYSQSNLKSGSTNVVNKDNYAWHAGAAYDADKWGVNAYYREIAPQFGAPGDWGRIGLWWNPTDIKGFGVGAHLNLTDTVMLSAMGQWYEGTGKMAAGLATDDKINRYTADLGFKVNDAWSANVGAEWVDWNLKARAGFGGGKPVERWYNIGLGYHLSDSTKLSLMWQVSDYDAKGTAGFNLFAGGAGNAGGYARATGSLLTTQLSVKF